MAEPRHTALRGESRTQRRKAMAEAVNSMNKNANAPRVPSPPPDAAPLLINVERPALLIFAAWLAE